MSGHTTHLVAASSPARARTLPFALLVTLLLAGGLCLLLALNTVAAADELRRSSLADSNEQLAGQVQQLSIQVAAEQAPQALAMRANALGMIPAAHPAFLVIGHNGTVTLHGSAGAAATPTPDPSPSVTPTPIPAVGAAVATSPSPTPEVSTAASTPTPAATPAPTVTASPAGTPANTVPLSTEPR